MNWNVLPLLQFGGRFCIEWYHLFFRYLVESTVKPFKPEVSLWKDFLTTNSIYLIDVGLDR